MLTYKNTDFALHLSIPWCDKVVRGIDKKKVRLKPRSDKVSRGEDLQQVYVYSFNPIGNSIGEFWNT